MHIKRCLPPGEWILSAVIALLYTVVMLTLAGATPSRLFSPYPYHSIQANALLSGHLSLADSIYCTKFDMVFFGGKVQQVWGLGPGLLIAICEGVGRCLHIAPIPDRIVMGISLAAFAFYVMNTSFRLADKGWNYLIRFSIAYLFLLSPPLWTLIVKGPQTVYEDSSIYALTVSMSILVAVIRASLFSEIRDYWICACLAAVSGLMRPTHLIYGLAGVTICFFLLVRGNKIKRLLPGIGIFVIGVTFLFVTNHLRFGSAMEFGHTMTVTTQEGTLTSRFVNPIQSASVVSAARELFGALFFCLGDIHAKGDFDQHLFPWQTDLFRWRNWYVSTYDPSLLVFLILAAIFGAFWTFKACRKVVNWPKGLLDPTFADVIPVLFIWSLSAIPIYAFLLYYPGLCARYLYDFWPGFLGALLLLLAVARRKGAGIVFSGVAVWLLVELGRADCRLDQERHLRREEARWTLAPTVKVPIAKFNGRYDLIQHPADGGFAILQSGWSKKDGHASYVVTVPVDRPQFVEIRVGKRTSHGSDTYRARIDNEELAIDRIGADPQSGGFCVRFDLPAKLRDSLSDHLLFLCFISNGSSEDLGSSRILYSVSWR